MNLSIVFLIFSKKIRQFFYIALTILLLFMQVVHT